MHRKPPAIHATPEPLWARPPKYHCPTCGANDGCMHPRAVEVERLLEPLVYTSSEATTRNAQPQAAIGA